MKCPECDTDTDVIQATLSCKITTTTCPHLRLYILYCPDCDWMTVTDWDRCNGEEEPDI